MKKMNEKAFLKEFRDLLAIDSTTGQFREIHNYMVKKEGRSFGLSRRRGRTACNYRSFG